MVTGLGVRYPSIADHCAGHSLKCRVKCRVWDDCLGLGIVLLDGWLLGCYFQITVGQGSINTLTDHIAVEDLSGFVGKDPHYAGTCQSDGI